MLIIYRQNALPFILVLLENYLSASKCSKKKVWNEEKKKVHWKDFIQNLPFIRDKKLEHFYFQNLTHQIVVVYLKAKRPKRIRLFFSFSALFSLWKKEHSFSVLFPLSLLRNERSTYFLWILFLILKAAFRYVSTPIA